MDYAFAYIKEKGGLETETNYPYRGVDQKCVANEAKFEAPKVESWVDVDQNNCDALVTAVAKNPVSVAIAANALQFYTSGIFANRFCGTGLNHGVVAVGYGTEGSGKDAKDFWIVRNSWGASWGEKGYVRMYRGDKIQPKTGICGICMDSSYPIVTKA